MQVLAWPYNGRPGKVNVMRSSPNPATWIRAQVTFRKVDNFFIVLFRAVAPNENNLYMAIDDVSVSEGACNWKSELVDLFSLLSDDDNDED